MVEQAKPRVIVYDDHSYYEGHDSVYLGYVKKAAQNNGWQALGFDDLESAVEEFDDTSKALVTILSTTGIIESIAKPLFEKSESLFIPRAVIAKNSLINLSVRRGSSDIAINISKEKDIPLRISSWLISIEAS